MKFSFKGIVIEIDHSTAVAVAAGIGMYIKALVIDYILGKNKTLKSNSIVELAENKLKGNDL